MLALQSDYLIQDFVSHVALRAFPDMELFPLTIEDGHRIGIAVETSTLLGDIIDHQKV